MCNNIPAFCPGSFDKAVNDVDKQNFRSAKNSDTSKKGPPISMQRRTSYRLKHSQGTGIVVPSLEATSKGGPFLPQVAIQTIDEKCDGVDDHSTGRIGVRSISALGY